MINVYLLQEHDGKHAGEIVAVSRNVAFGLIDSGKARATVPDDFMVKSEMGKTKAFKVAPSKKFRKVQHSAVVAPTEVETNQHIIS